MIKNTRKILSVLLTMIMVMSFACPVFADETVPEDREEATAVSEEETLKTGNEADESAESEAADVQAEMDKPEPEDTAAETVNDVPVTESTAAAPETLEASRRASGSTGNAEKAENITIDGTSIDGSEDSSGNGWIYEKESGRIVLRDYTGSADITSDGTGVEIVSTGYNRIGTLSCDGDINVIGTGVLLVDKVELAEGCSFNLLPLQEYYGEDGGSVAVFLQQEDGSYMLINGNVKGIIDEKLELPEDIRLVLPADSLLELQALIFRVETDEDGNRTGVTDISGNSYTDYHDNQKECYGGHLYVGDLTLNKGATIKLNRVSDVIISSLTVVGSLVNDGVINGGLVDAVGYSGSGIIENSQITLSQGQTTSIKLRDANVSLERGDYTLNELNITGNCELYYEGNVELKKIKSSSNGSLSIYSRNIFNDNRIVKITDEIEKVSVVIKSAITELEADLKVNEATVSNQTYGGPVFDYSGKGTVSYGINGSVYLGPKDIIMPEADSIPVVSLALLDTRKPLLYYTWEENVNEEEVYTQLADYNVSEKNEEGLITYTDLLSSYVPEEILSEFGVSPFLFEVLRCKNGRLSMTILGYGYQQSTDADGVFLIRKVVRTPTEENSGGSAMTTTHASQTGSGNIGGNSKPIFTGTGISRFSSEDPVEPEPKPEPKPVDPDPGKPAGDYTIAAVTTVGDTIVLQINEFDLNEGVENAEKAPYYNLTAYINGAQITELSGVVEAEMEYVLPEEFRDKPLYAVFANEDETSDETLAAVKAEYDEESGTIRFETSQLGEFIIAALEFDGEEFSPEFYDELEKTDEAKLFIEHLKERKEG